MCQNCKVSEGETCNEENCPFVQYTSYDAQGNELASVLYCSNCGHYHI
jgi:hypothetical protein